MTWQQAFLTQAKDDYEMFVHLNEISSAECQQLHFLQMATEKLAKAFLCGLDNAPPKTSHDALTKFLRVIKGRPEIRKKLGYAKNHVAFASYIDSLLPIAGQIENLAPEGGNLRKINPEYPWESHTGEIVAPVDFKYRYILGRQMEISRFKTLIENLIHIGIS